MALAKIHKSQMGWYWSFSGATGGTYEADGREFLHPVKSRDTGMNVRQEALVRDVDKIQDTAVTTTPPVSGF